VNRNLLVIEDEITAWVSAYLLYIPCRSVGCLKV